MTKRVVIFEVEGGSDKTFNGHRKDTLPIRDSIREKGIECEVIYYRPEWEDTIFEAISEYDAYIPRVNPGNVPGGEAGFFRFLNRLGEAGLVGMPAPVVMTEFGAKDALVKLSDTKLVPDDTYAYYEIDQLRESFPVSLSKSQRVLKQNRGSTGSGIWRVEVIDEREFTPGEALPLDAKIRCTEAVDNHQEERELGEFMDFCEQYTDGEGGMVVDMTFLPRIVEGEIRILLVGTQPMFVVHKKPAEEEGAFSATLFSGAKYTYDEPEKWSELIDMFQDAFPTVRERLGNFDAPLIWTADFMLDDAPEGGDAYVLGEFNCSCVGFTSHLDRGIQDSIAAEVASRLGL